MKTKFLSILAGAVMLGPGSASAVTYTDNVNFGLDGILFNLGGFNNLSTSETFDITDDGYNPANEEIISFSVTLSLADLLGGNESFAITLGPRTFGGLGPVPSFSFSTDSTDPLNAGVLADLSAEGKLDISVALTSGFLTGFQVVSADLTAESRAVPEGGSSIALLGLGMCGMAGLKRRFARK
jgi:hypothetical protein